MNPTSLTPVEALRNRLTPLAKQLLEDFVNTYLTTGHWPLVRAIHSKYDKTRTREALLALGGAVVQEAEDHNNGNRYSLLLFGALLTKKGAVYYQWWIKYFEYLRHLFLTDPDKRILSSEEIRQALELSEKDAKVFGELAALRPIFERTLLGGGWGMRVPDEVEDFPREGPLNATFETFLVRRIPLDSTVYRADQSAAPQALMFLQEGWPSSSAPVVPAGIDVLKRRYQVFVWLSPPCGASSLYVALHQRRQTVRLLATIA